MNLDKIRAALTEDEFNRAYVLVMALHEATDIILEENETVGNLALVMLVMFAQRELNPPTRALLIKFAEADDQGDTMRGVLAAIDSQIEVFNADPMLRNLLGDISPPALGPLH